MKNEGCSCVAVALCFTGLVSGLALILLPETSAVIVMTIALVFLAVAALLFPDKPKPR